MATLKHISSKNSDYSAIEAYLIYQHDAFTGKQLLDEQGKPKLRESYLLDTLECGDFSFATACLLANRKYGKNTQHGDIKSHQYIISFDPRDAADNGLTMEKAQALGLKFCEENFPGHPAIVCTHPDGHNHSGNIHVHIVIGSIRKSPQTLPLIPMKSLTVWHGHSTRPFLPAGTARKASGSLPRGRRNRLITPPTKRNRAFPTGNALLYISLSSVVFGRVRPIQGRTLFLF